MTQTYEQITHVCRSNNLFRARLGKQHKITNQLLEYSNQKVVLHEFKDIISFDFTNGNTRNPNDTPTTPKHILRHCRFRRARKTLIELIEHNKNTFPEITNKFITLTYADNFQDITESNKNFKAYIRRMRRTFCSDFQYIAVLEFQKRGAIHYHLFSPNFPRLSREDIQRHTTEIWGHGRAEIKEVSQHHDYLGLYLGKYTSKDTYDERLDGQKAFFTSREIVRPQVIKNPKDIHKLLDNLDLKPVIVEEYTNKFDKTVRKTTYK
jgi:hypothetical protein